MPRPWTVARLLRHNKTLMDEARTRDLRQGLRLETMTILWMLVMAVVTIASGIHSRSALLMTVGAGCAIDMFSACTLYWELGREARGLAVPTHESEKRVARTVGVLLLLTAVFAVGVSAYKLSTRVGTEDSAPGLLVALVSAVWMPFLGHDKIELAEDLKSRALRADGTGTKVCGLMSLVVLLGLATNAAFRWWWLDSVGAIMLVPLLFKEARETWIFSE